MITQTTTSPAPEVQQTPEQCSILDFELFSSVDAILVNDEKEKLSLKKLKKEVKEKEEDGLIQFFCEIPTGSSERIAMLQKTENTEKQKIVNTIAIGSAVAILQAIESVPADKKEAIWGEIKLGNFSNLPQEKVSEKMKAALELAQMVCHGTHLENSAGKILKDSWGKFVGDLQTAETFGVEMEKNNGIDASHTASSVTGGLVGSSLLSRGLAFIPHPAAKIAAGAVGYFAGSSAGSAIDNQLSGENHKSFFESMGDAGKTVGESVKEGWNIGTHSVAEALKGAGMNAEKAENLSKAGVGIGVAALVGIGLFKLFSGDDEPSSEKKEKTGWGVGKTLAVGALALLGIPMLAKYGKDLIPDWVKDPVEAAKNKVGEAVDGAVEAGKEELLALKAQIPFLKDINNETILENLKTVGIAGGIAGFLLLLKSPLKNAFTITKALFSFRKIVGIAAITGVLSMLGIMNTAQAEEVQQANANGESDEGILGKAEKMLGLEGVGEKVSEGMENISEGFRNFYDQCFFPCCKVWESTRIFDGLRTVNPEITIKMENYAKDRNSMWKDFQDWAKETGTGTMVVGGLVAYSSYQFLRFFVSKTKTLFNPALWKGISGIAGAYGVYKLLNNQKLPLSAQEIELFGKGCNETINITYEYCEKLVKNENNAEDIRRVLEGTNDDDGLIPKNFQKIFGRYFADEFWTPEEKTKNTPALTEFLANVKGEKGMEKDLHDLIATQQKNLIDGEPLHSQHFSEMAVMAKELGWKISVVDGEGENQFLTTFEKDGKKIEFVLHHNILPKQPTAKNLLEGMRSKAIESAKNILPYCVEIDFPENQRASLTPIHNGIRDATTLLKRQLEEKNADIFAIVKTYKDTILPLLEQRNAVVSEKNKIILQSENGIFTFFVWKNGEAKEVLPFFPEQNSLQEFQKFVATVEEKEGNTVDNPFTKTTENFKTFLSWQLKRYANDDSQKGKDMRALCTEYLSEETDITDFVELPKVIFQLMTMDEDWKMNILDAGITLNAAGISFMIPFGTLLFQSLYDLCFREGNAGKDWAGVAVGGIGTGVSVGVGLGGAYVLMKSGSLILNTANGKIPLKLPFKIAKSGALATKWMSKKVGMSGSWSNRFIHGMNESEKFIDKVYASAVHGRANGVKLVNAQYGIKPLQEEINKLLELRANSGLTDADTTKLSNAEAKLAQLEADIKSVKGGYLQKAGRIAGIAGAGFLTYDGYQDREKADETRKTTGNENLAEVYDTEGLVKYGEAAGTVVATLAGGTVALTAGVLLVPVAVIADNTFKSAERAYSKHGDYLQKYKDNPEEIVKMVTLTQDEESFGDWIRTSTVGKIVDDGEGALTPDGVRQEMWVAYAMTQAKKLGIPADSQETFGKKFFEIMLIKTNTNKNLWKSYSQSFAEAEKTITETLKFFAQIEAADTKQNPPLNFYQQKFSERNNAQIAKENSYQIEFTKMTGIDKQFLEVAKTIFHWDGKKDPKDISGLYSTENLHTFFSEDKETTYGFYWDKDALEWAFHESVPFLPDPNISKEETITEQLKFVVERLLTRGNFTYYSEHESFIDSFRDKTLMRKISEQNTQEVAEVFLKKYFEITKTQEIFSQATSPFHAGLIAIALWNGKKDNFSLESLKTFFKHSFGEGYIVDSKYGFSWNPENNTWETDKKKMSEQNIFPEIFEKMLSEEVFLSSIQKNKQDLQRTMIKSKILFSIGKNFFKSSKK